MRIIARAKHERGTIRVAWLKSRKHYKVWWSDSETWGTKQGAMRLFKYVKGGGANKCK